MNIIFLSYKFKNLTKLKNNPEIKLMGGGSGHVKKISYVKKNTGLYSQREMYFQA